MKILVIGDGCYDIFRYGNIDRICPEAPVPVFNPTKETNVNPKTVPIFFAMVLSSFFAHRFFAYN